uniref:Mitochondrial transcription termination factor n=1 Tax=Tetraselmis sp. GSL018 TaxID=582737 RepID=A0A061RGI5_9CHLO|mmetsp:Transcript_28021/g.66559  ORF Transcript_28021/g.66559 Transcript_28021/m.66559 type:complete len:228 (-) Transcript_28021:933-1616(-)
MLCKPQVVRSSACCVAPTTRGSPHSLAIKPFSVRNLIRPRSFHPFHLQTYKAAASTVEKTASAEAVPYDSPAVIKKHLLDQGWQLTWVDWIADEVKKGRLRTTVARAQAALDALAPLRLPSDCLENMCAKAPGILACEPEAIKAVLDYLSAQGATEEEVKAMVSKTPKMLTYSVTADGKQLALGKARMEVDITKDGDKRRPVVSMYRVGTAFESAPLSPWRPIHERS